ncbi:MAG: PD-(D/E)XK nuclease family protein [Acidimicrobiales bacterium]
MAFEQPLPKSLSPSRLSDFQTCPRRYQHGSIERLPQPASYASAKGRFVHYVFEHLFLLDKEERTIERARGFVAPAIDEILTPDVRIEIDLDDAVLAKLLSETEGIIQSYFEMEDPTSVNHEGVELGVGVDVDGTPLLGILDRLDRASDGSLTIVDYKTGSLPNRNYDSQTFANTELYAALCEAKLGERPSTIRLMYVAHGQAIERPVSDVVVRARAKAAASAWTKINRYYQDGDFPATPSSHACRFCAFKDLCRSEGVPVPVR